MFMFDNNSKEATKNDLIEWMQSNLIRTKKVNNRVSCDFLRSKFEEQTGLYTSLVSFKYIANELGYKITDTIYNCFINVSVHSPAIVNKGE